RRHRAPQRPLRAPPRRTWGLEWTGSWRQQAAGVFRLTTPGPPGPAARGYNRRALVGEARGPTPALPKAQTPVIAQARYHRTRQTLWRDRPAPPDPAPKGHEARDRRPRASKLSGKRTEGHHRSGPPAPFPRMPEPVVPASGGTAPLRPRAAPRRPSTPPPPSGAPAMSKPSLRELEHHDAFIERHIGPNDAEIAHMLAAIGHDSLESMTAAIVPASIKGEGGLALPPPQSEDEALARIRAIASRNDVFRSFIGQGYYGTRTPHVILRNILENPAWYTAYTPYQAEISQGRMEALINFQQMCAGLPGMDIANASLLDEATAAAEAMPLARRSSRSKSNLFFVADHVHPQPLEVVRTRADGLGIELVVGPAADAATADSFG